MENNLVEQNFEYYDAKKIIGSALNHALASEKLEESNSLHFSVSFEDNELATLHEDRFGENMDDETSIYNSAFKILDNSNW